MKVKDYISSRSWWALYSAELFCYKEELRSHLIRFVLKIFIKWQLLNKWAACIQNERKVKKLVFFFFSKSE